jgi:hypothetical protein
MVITADVNSAPVFLYCAYVGNVADVSEAPAASIFRAGVCIRTQKLVHSTHFNPQDGSNFVSEKSAILATSTWCKNQQQNQDQQ